MPKTFLRIVLALAARRVAPDVAVFCAPRSGFLKRHAVSTARGNLRYSGPMQLQDILFSQGFGTRRVCAGLVQQGHVTVGGQSITDAAAEFEPDGCVFPWMGSSGSTTNSPT